MTQDGELAGGTRRAIKVGICLLLVGQILANGYRLLYLHNRVAPILTNPRAVTILMPALIYLMIPALIYLMMTNVPDVLKKSAGIRRQAIHYADWWLAFGIWQFLAGMGQGPLIVLFAIGALIMVLSIKDAIQVEA
jgi:hypothetical protein